MVRLAVALSAFVLATTPGLGGPVEREIKAPGPQGPLRGALRHPATPAPPVVLIIPGSGPTDRDGNNLLGIKAATYRLVAEGLAARGIASVTLPRLKVGIVAGSANNQLARDDHGETLAKRGILYVPDYVINMGGIININYEGPNYDAEAAFAHAARIGETAAEIFRAAQAEDQATNIVADRLAEARIAAARTARVEETLRLAS